MRHAHAPLQLRRYIAVDLPIRTRQDASRCPLVMVEAGQCGLEMEWTYLTFTLVSAVISGRLNFVALPVRTVVWLDVVVALTPDRDDEEGGLVARLRAAWRGE